MILIAGQEGRDLADLLLRCSRQDRIAVKMNGCTMQPRRIMKCRHGRVDAARQQARRFAPGAEEAAGARLLAEEIERVRGQHLDMDGEISLVEIDAPSPGHLDAPANLAFDLRRGIRKSLVGPSHADAEGAGFAAPEISQESTARCTSKSTGRPARAREVGDADYGRSRSRIFSQSISREHSILDAAHDMAQRGDAHVAQRVTQIADEDIDDEPGPVLALERELFVVDDDEFISGCRDGGG